MTAMKNIVLFIFCILIINGCITKEDKLFKKHEAALTNIHFNNKVIENDSVNPIDLEFLYNGGGIAAGDFNNDGLTDLYFTASEVSNKLYLNKGNFEFSDVTDIAMVSGEGMWSNGASVVDINSDGLQDIYVCMAIKKDPHQRRNLLYVNQGADKNGVPVFRELAKEYNVADTGFSVQGAFFDYDNDGDLDLYVVETKLVQRNVAELSGRNPGEVARADADKLYRNDWNDSLKHPVFTDVSLQAGIKEPGYGLGLSIADINNDGLEDFFICGAAGQAGNLFLQQNNHRFRPTLQPAFQNDSAAEDVHAAFFDADADGDNDLYVVSGGGEYCGKETVLLDRLYINDSKGHFTKSNRLPLFYGNKSVVVPIDFDRDNDMDVFVGGRVDACSYGRIPDSYLLINDGTGRFSLASFGLP
ncbi:MAG: VCBS repeat-containing protein [Chitinophagaceae bacterium]|nr:MAG: VCBS repeat-containing protein [Chitinophagaceae bacterium]